MGPLSRLRTYPAMHDHQEKIAHYLSRAKEMREEATSIRHDQTRELMLHVAANYEKLAETLRKQQADSN